MRWLVVNHKVEFLEFSNHPVTVISVFESILYITSTGILQVYSQVASKLSNRSCLHTQTMCTSFLLRISKIYFSSTFIYFQNKYSPTSVRYTHSQQCIGLYDKYSGPCPHALTNE